MHWLQTLRQKKWFNKCTFQTIVQQDNRWFCAKAPSQHIEKRFCVLLTASTVSKQRAWVFFFICEIGKRNRYVRLIDHSRMRAPTALESGNNAQHVFSFFLRIRDLTLQVLEHNWWTFSLSYFASLYFLCFVFDCRSHNELGSHPPPPPTQWKLFRLDFLRCESF